MTAEFLRDTAATAAILGFFASGWFGWAQDAPPPAWRKALVAGSVMSLLAAVAGGVLAWRHWSDGTVFDADTSRAFGVIVGVELALAGLGAVVLAARRRSDLIPAWIALVVGVHLFPVASLLRYPLLHLVAALVTLGALAAVPLARSRSLGGERRHRAGHRDRAADGGAVLGGRCPALAVTRSGLRLGGGEHLRPAGLPQPHRAHTTLPISSTRPATDDRPQPRLPSSWLRSEPTNSRSRW